MLSGAISILLIQKTDLRQLIPCQSNFLIQVLQLVDPAMVEIEVLEHWQRLKVNKILLNKYLEEGKIELLKRKVKSATGI